MNAQGWGAQETPAQTAAQEGSLWAKGAEAPGCQLLSCSLSSSVHPLVLVLPGLLLQSTKLLAPATAVGVDALNATSVPGSGLHYACNQTQAKRVETPIPCTCLQYIQPAVLSSPWQSV